MYPQKNSGELNPNNEESLSALRRAELAVNRKRPSDALLKFEVSTPETIKKALAVPDLTKDDAPVHIINLILKDVSKNLEKLGMGSQQIVRTSPIVTVADNFDNLLFPYDNAGRSSTYTRYVDENHILRTHTSAAIPRTLRNLYETHDGDIPDTMYLFPGLVYRRDVIDPRHLDVFHQLDVWTIRKNGTRKPIERKDLLLLVENIFESIFPDSRKPIIYEAVHPYTIGGIEVYAKSEETELEVLEAGLIHPLVLEKAGFDPNLYSGLALGMGIDRLVMSLKELPDIRFLRSQEPRIASQMHDASKFRPVSNMPAISRNMSYCVPNNYTEEDICEEIKDAFGEDAFLLENVSIENRTKYGDLLPVAIEKLGALPNQDNVLVKIQLRHPDKTLTKEEANSMYDRAYPVLNKGTKGYYG